ncbi:hypothetical protein Tco_0087963 [Tanacetum coccineum]
MIHLSPKRNMVPKAVLMRSGLVLLTTTRPVNTAQPRTTVNSASPMTNVFNKAHSTVRRPINKNTTVKNSNFNQRVNTVKDKNVNAARPKAVVNVVRPKAVFNAVKGNQVNAVKDSACWVWKPKTKGNPQIDLQDQGVIDSGCSRHMTGNMSYLTDYEKIDGEYVAFGGNLKGGKITGKGNQSNGNAGTKACDDAGGNSSNDQEKKDNVNSTNNVNAASTNEVNVVGAKTSIELPDDPNMPELEDIVYSDDDEDVGAEADMNNLNTFMLVSPIPTTIIHKDHPVEQIIRDLNSAPQTRRMTKNLEEHDQWIGSLMYLLLPRPDICLQYVPMQDTNIHDIDYAGASLDRKSTSGDSNEKKLIQMIKIHTDKNVADLLTKTFDVKTVNGEQQLQALVDGKKIVVTEASVRRDIQLDDEEGTDCLPNAPFFVELTRLGQGKDFSGRETPLFPTMVVQAQEEMGEGSAMPTDPHHTPIITQPSSSQPQRKQKSSRPKEKDTQNTKTAQAQEITSLKLRVKKLEKKGGSRTHKLKRLYRVGRSARVVSSEEAKITLVDETQGRYGDEDMFGVNNLDGDEVVVESEVTDKAGKKRNIVEEAVAVTDAVTIPVSAATITNVELTLAQTLAELKSARPKTKRGCYARAK